MRERGGGILASCTDDPRGRAMGYRPIEEGLALLAEADKIYFHNGIGFDIPAIWKVYPDWVFRGELIDTLVVASFRFAHQKAEDMARAKRRKFPTHLVGRHSLEAWGRRLGIHKGEYQEWCRENGIEEPFAEWRPEMQEYCERDTEVTDKLADYLRDAGGIPPMAMRIEHELAKYLAQQQRNGWPFDVERAMGLYAELSARKQELADKLVEEYGSWYAPDGKVVKPKRTVTYSPGKRFPSPTTFVEGAPYQKIKLVEFNPNSQHHIVKVLQERHGWVPSEFTPTGLPKLDEGVLRGLNLTVSEDLLEYLLVDKRLGMLASGKQAWLDHVKDGKIHHKVWQNNCVTHRASHVAPNAAQVPAAKRDKKTGELVFGRASKWGTDCRALWTAPPGGEWVMVGADASGLELRCLAHYMAAYDDGEYGRIILEGDIHTANMEALQSAGYPQLTRDHAKTFIYAYLYGAGDAKLGSIIAPAAPVDRQRKIGKKLRAAFEEQIPALGMLVAKVKARTTENKGPGYLVMPDGRRTYIRHQHAALNSLLQAAGAIICKLWIVLFNERLMEEFGVPYDRWWGHGGGWDCQWAALGWIHDEVQLAVRKEHAERVGQILVESIRDVGTMLNWKIPLDGEYKIGPTWAHTH